MRVEPLSPATEDSFLKFIRQDVISNFFALLDLKLYRRETKFWVAVEDAEISGYMLEHDERDLNLRGDVKSAAKLLNGASLIEPLINIEPRHFSILKTFYEPIRRLGPPTEEKISTLLVMGMDRKHFRPIVERNPKELGADELEVVGGLYRSFYEEAEMGPITREDILKAFRGRLIHGTFEGGELVSFASGVTIEDLSYVGHVYTLPKFRGRGHAISTCSALVNALLERSEKVIIMVLADNNAARRVYRKIGFVETGHEFLAFKGRKISG
jgi:GNAT superfamily N-acetyltransferase